MSCEDEIMAVCLALLQIVIGFGCALTGKLGDDQAKKPDEGWQDLHRSSG